MKKYTLIIIVTWLLITVNVAAQKGKPTVSNPRAIALFGSCEPGDSNCENTNRVRQDVTGVPYRDGESGVSAVFNLGSGSRDLTINLITSQRAVLFDFRVLTGIASEPGSAVPAWWANSPEQLVKPHFNVLGAYYAKENCPLEASECDFITKMNAGGWKASGYSTTDYSLLWNPTAQNRKVNSPESTVFVNIKYTRNDGSGEKFEISPVPNGSGQSIAGLESTVKKSVNYAGQYDMPFLMTVRTF